MLEFWGTIAAIVLAMVAILSYLRLLRKDAKVFYEWKGEITQFKSSVVSFMEQTKDDIQDLTTKVGIILGRTHVSTQAVKGESPLGLTEYGETISNEIEGKLWADELTQELFIEADGKEPYEIQELAYSFVFNSLNPTIDQEDTISKVAFQHGIPRETVLEVLAIELRNSLLDNQ